MSTLTREKLQEIIKEEVELHRHKNEWDFFIKPQLSDIRNNLINKGYGRHSIDENFSKALFGSLMGAGGGTGADALGLGGSEGLLGGASGGIRTAIEQTAIEKIVSLMGLDPFVGFGLILKNAIEQSIKQLSGDEMKSLLSGEQGKCLPVSEKITSITLTSIEEAMKEGILNMLMEAIVGELGEDFKRNPLTKPIYQNMREKFSDAFGMMLQDPQLHSDISKTICDNLNIETILSAAGEAGMASVGNAMDAIEGLELDSIGSALGDTLKGFE